MALDFELTLVENRAISVWKSKNEVKSARSVLSFLSFFLKPLESMGQSLEEAIRVTLRTNPDVQASAYNLPQPNS